MFIGLYALIILSVIAGVTAISISQSAVRDMKRRRMNRESQAYIEARCADIQALYLSR